MSIKAIEQAESLEKLVAENQRLGLYDAPKEWVGLTGEEVGTLTVFDGLTHIEVPILADFIRAIEAKLKEKNCPSAD